MSYLRDEISITLPCWLWWFWVLIVVFWILDAVAWMVLEITG